eukprot:2822191-Rhodomonas_salina.1
MSSFNWNLKNHPLKKLHETDLPHVRATLSSFVIWKDCVIRSTAAVGRKYITKLVAWLMAKPELIPMFADVGIAVDEFRNADYKSIHFNRAIVALATLCGKNWGTLDVERTDEGVLQGVEVLKTELASFSIQVKNDEQLHHSECFVGNGLLITNHPLCEVIEWKLLEKAINPFKASAPTSLWAKLQAA